VNANIPIRRFLSKHALAILLLFCSPALCQRQKLPPERQLDKGLQFQRDSSTGVLHVLGLGASESDRAAEGAIRVRVDLVPVTCSVFAPDGMPLRGLTATDFRVFDNGAPQSIAYFDASEMPASVALLIDASPSVLRDSSEMKQAEQALLQNLSVNDDIAVIDFSEHSYLLLPFSRDRNLLTRAVSHVDVRELFYDTGGTNIYEAVYATAQLFAGRSGRKAIVLLTDGQDSGLGLTLDPATASPRAGDPPDRLTFDDVSHDLAGQDIQVFAISTENRPRIMTAAWINARRTETFLAPNDRQWNIPAYTLYLAELVRRSGGELFFLNEAKTLAETYRRIAGSISAEYVLGFYPSEAARVTCSHNASPVKILHHLLSVELADRPNATVVHRTEYFTQQSP
jgi:VWFA-related protein